MITFNSMPPTAELKTTSIATPIGEVFLVGSGRTLVRVVLPGTEVDFVKDKTARDDEALDPAARELQEYFAGERRQFSLELAPGGTRFQREVWRALLAIPYAGTVTYGEIASRIGNPKASRAVGMANNRNPLPIVIPCHRVIGANGTLVGYAGGLTQKQALLDLEAKS